MKNKRILTISATQNLYGYLFILPAIFMVALFQIYPIVNGFVLSFTDWNGVHDANLIGLQNYVRAFSDKTFLQTLKNTFMFVVLSVPFILVLSLLFASLLNLPLIGKKAFRSIYFLPAIASSIAMAMVWRWLFNTNTGLINALLSIVGLPQQEWLTSSKLAIASIVIMNVWKSLGTNIVIMLAGLQGIPRHLYEAYTLDADSHWKRLWHITIPMLSPTIFLIMIMSIINAFQIFEQVIVLTDGGPGDSSLVMVLYIYRQAFRNFNLGYASTLAYILFFIILFVTLIQWYGKKRWVYSELD